MICLEDGNKKTDLPLDEFVALLKGYLEANLSELQDTLAVAHPDGRTMYYYRGRDAAFRLVLEYISEELYRLQVNKHMQIMEEIANGISNDS